AETYCRTPTAERLSPGLSLILLKRNQERHNCPNRHTYTPEALLSERICSSPQDIPVIPRAHPLAGMQSRTSFMERREIRFVEGFGSGFSYSKPLVTPLGALATQCSTCCQRPFSFTQVSPNTLSAVSTLPL